VYSLLTSMLLGSLPACQNKDWEKSQLKSHTEIDDATVGGTHDQTKPFKIFFKWLIEGGTEFPLLSLRFFSNIHRAINSKRTIQRDVDVLFVPFCQLMTTEIALDSEVGKQIIDSGVQVRSRHSYLASYLLQEKANSKSYWKPYIDILPATYDTIPLFFSEEQLAELEGSMAIGKIQDRHELLQLEYKSLVKNVPMYSDFAYEDFVWARLVVITRIFGMVIDGKKTEGLVPMADMLNHKRPRETKWTYAQNRKGFVITTLNVIEKGCEVFDSYGRKCNSRYFVNYGFVPEKNEDNEAVMYFELKKDDPTKDLKYGISNYSLMNVKRFQIPLQYNDPNNKVRHAFSYVRFLVATKEDLKFFDEHDFSSTNVPPLNYENEGRVLEKFAEAAKEALEGFTHNLAHDQKLLADLDKYPLFSNARNIVLMRSGEKTVLEYFINLNEQVGPILKHLAEDPTNIKVDLTTLDEDMRNYLNAVRKSLDGGESLPQTE